MRHTYINLFIISIILCIGCDDKLNYEQIASYQDHSIPEINVEVVDSSKVLVIVPHADDETIAGGLISFFHDKRGDSSFTHSMWT